MEDIEVKAEREFITTGIPGFDKLFKRGIPKGSTVLIAGGTGSGKTNFCLQMLVHHASQGKNVITWVLKNLKRQVNIDGFYIVDSNSESITSCG